MLNHLSEDFSDFQYIDCDCCGSHSMIKKENVNVKHKDGTDDNLTLYVCMICGDSTTIETLDNSRSIVERKTYQVSMRPKLEEIKREDRKRNAIEFEYLLGGDRITEEELTDEVKRRRKLLKSIVNN